MRRCGRGLAHGQLPGWVRLRSCRRDCDGSEDAKAARRVRLGEALLTAGLTAGLTVGGGWYVSTRVLNSQVGHETDLATRAEDINRKRDKEAKEQGRAAYYRELSQAHRAYSDAIYQLKTALEKDSDAAHKFKAAMKGERFKGEHYSRDDPRVKVEEWNTEGRVERLTLYNLPTRLSQAITIGQQIAFTNPYMRLA